MKRVGFSFLNLKVCGTWNWAVPWAVQQGDWDWSPEGSGNEEFRLVTGGQLDHGRMAKMCQREDFKNGNGGTQKKGEV